MVGSGALTAVVLAKNYMLAMDKHGQYWTSAGADPGELNPEGWWFLLLQLAPFWFVTIFQYIRVFAGISLLSAYAKLATEYPGQPLLDINPLHPDRVGGLQPVARLGLQNLMLMAVATVTLGTFISVYFGSTVAVAIGPWLRYAPVAAYVVVTPIVFFGPLFPFRRHLLECKRKYLHLIAERFKADLDATLDGSDGAHEADEDSRRLDRIERLTQIHERIDRLPGWPLDITTTAKSIAVLVSPAIGVVIPWLFEIAAKNG